ncbi:RNA polymerase II transcription factor B subunit 2 [Lecanosticta acicola]|uniref:RNA polymerase II transcription factor B subunit 2 n=1 Tax=Lecanosticta acicola TaxID=111012 RepID=A0AAI8YSI2_9PEZI|nr:RNA polymerase II transcription factor B subunit 2 [Lecanosticta acicola]
MSSSAQRALDYLEQLPGTTFNQLYQQPSAALAIFRRMLPHLAKTIVMAMLYLPTPFPVADLDVWVKPDLQSMQARDRALNRLQLLRILFDDKENGQPAYKLSAQFAKSLRQALTGGGNHSSFGVPCPTPDKRPVTVDFLDTFAGKQWEAILYYVVGSANSSLSGEVDISMGTKKLLQNGEYVALKSGGRQRLITTKGFTFLLQEVNAQIWSLLIVYLEMAPTLSMDPVEVLSFLFTLGSLELGISYSTSNLTNTQHQMLEDLSDFGLVYRQDPSATRYYPTRLATTLTSDAPALLNSNLMSTTVSSASAPADMASSANEKGYIILETNYRLYAYTSSPLLISILSLFATLHTRYPNLITAKITKPSIQNAIQAGISSDQIINYLTSHAHPVLRRQAAIHNAPILPPTVVDQIRLWQMEGERMETTKGYLIRDMGPDFEAALEFASNIGVLQMEFRKKGMFFVSRMDQMSGWFKRRAEERKKAKEAALAKQQAASKE